MRLSVDVGGTFTDLIIQEQNRPLQIYKAPTTPADPVLGVLDVLRIAAERQSMSVEEFLSRCEMLLHATTRSTNATLTGGTATTAFLTTEGHPDILLLREGGRKEPFNYKVLYPLPYVPRRLTFEVPERVGSDGSIIKPLDVIAVGKIVSQLLQREVEAVAVCLLWSIINPIHEERVGALLEQALPNIPFTLSHRLNPSLREYRRASSTCIDASLKPLMENYLGSLESRLREVGFQGRLLTATSLGSVVDAAQVAKAPIHSINSGPSMAPIAGRFYADVDGGSETAIIADAGGTSYDVSLVRRGRIPWTRETWLGEPFRGHMTGFPSVDVRSVGAGGGSVAWVDDGGMLHVGPHSSGSIPGPACYGRGGTRPTVTDAALTLGYLDPHYFLGGAIKLDLGAAERAIETQIARVLGLTLDETADAIIRLSTENMIHAIEDITINQGIDPSSAILIGGGGASGFNAVQIARRLHCRGVVIPATGAVLSAAGALISDLSTEYSTACFTTTANFDFEHVNRKLKELEEQCLAFINGPGTGTLAHSIEFYAEARYPHQIWEVEVPLGGPRFSSQEDVSRLALAMHTAHQELFSFNDPGSDVEIVAWRARVTCRLPKSGDLIVANGAGAARRCEHRLAWFANHGRVAATIYPVESITVDRLVEGPCIVESDFATVVIDPNAAVQRTASGSLWIRPEHHSLSGQ